MNTLSLQYYQIKTRKGNPKDNECQSSYRNRYESFIILLKLLLKLVKLLLISSKEMMVNHWSSNGAACCNEAMVGICIVFSYGNGCTEVKISWELDECSVSTIKLSKPCCLVILQGTRLNGMIYTKLWPKSVALWCALFMYTNNLWQPLWICFWWE